MCGPSHSLPGRVTTVRPSGRTDFTASQLLVSPRNSTLVSVKSRMYSAVVAVWVVNSGTVTLPELMMARSASTQWARFLDSNAILTPDPKRCSRADATASTSDLACCQVKVDWLSSCRSRSHILSGHSCAQCANCSVRVVQSTATFLHIKESESIPVFRVTVGHSIRVFARRILVRVVWGVQRTIFRLVPRAVAPPTAR